MKTTLKSLPAIIISIIVVVGITYAAGSLTAPTGTPSATGYTLGDIYNKLTNSINATEENHDLSTTSDPGVSFASLLEIYEAIPNSFGQLGKTGQTLCYDDVGNTIDCTGTTGQDADYDMGLSASFTDNSDGTVTDNVTGLMWSKCSHGLTGSDCSIGSASALEWLDAITACEELDLADYNDWRLPNIRELFSIVSFFETDSNSMIDSSVFHVANYQGSFIYWSSTSNPRPGGSWKAYSYNFGIDGVLALDAKAFDNYHVFRCVRG